jgi:defect-in-organelle-trafficking protein DotB
VCYEAPIEYVYDAIKSPRSLISQTEVPRHLPDFARGVRNALRRKPNIILVGEARDKETIAAAIEAAQTGHTVYTTTHTTGVASTIQRMVATFDPNERSERAYALMETVRLVVTQTLVPRVNGGRVGCREWMRFNDDVRDKFLSMDFKLWPAEIQRIIQFNGQTMATSAGILFDKGLIDRRTYIMLSSSTGAGGGD